MKLICVAFFLLTNLILQGQVLETGPGKTYPTIKKALANASAGDTILVYPGVYKEGNIIVAKPVTLIGIDFPVLDGGNEVEILTLTGADIVVKGFELRNTGQSSLNDYAAIKVIDAQDVLVERNRIFDAYFAIHLSNTIRCTVRGNFVKGTPTTEQNTGNGVHLWKSSHARIEKNYLSGHRDGIYLEFVTESLIQHNISENNIRYGLHFMFSHDDTYLNNTFRNNGAGVAVMYSRNVHMENNFFDLNWGAAAYAILLKEISDSKIIHNLFRKNTVGIFMEGTNRIMVQRNIFRENGWAMRVQASCNDNTFINNNFFGNTFDVATNGTMMLNEFTNNYWDKYEGYDIDKNGIGDIPYHPVSMYSMIVEKNQNALILLRSTLVSLLDRAEKAIPSLTPQDLKDDSPLMKPLKL